MTAADTDARAKLWWIAGALLLIACVAAWLGRGNWLHQVFSLGFGLWVVTPCVLIGLVALRYSSMPVAAVCLAMILGWAIQFGAGFALLKWDIARGKIACERIVPALDGFHTRTGHYPAPDRLATVLANRDIAALPEKLVYYYSDGSTFTCEVTNPAELFGGFTYTDSARRWVEWRD